MNKNAARYDLALTGVIAALALVVFWDALSIPAGVFEPLGGGPIPRLVSASIVAFCVLNLVGVLRAIRQPPVPTPPPQDAGPAGEPFTKRPWSALALMVLSVLYVLVMVSSWTSYALATSAFLFLAISGLNQFRRAVLWKALAIGLAVGFGCQYIFTRVFVIDLPY